MKSSGMRWIIPAVIVAITALIIFQINWLVREAEMKKEDEKRRIAEALHATCVAMEEYEARGFIGNTFDSVFVRYPAPGHDSVRIQYHGDSAGHVVVVNENYVPAHSVLSPLPSMPPMPSAAPMPPMPPMAPMFDSLDIPELPEDEEWIAMQHDLDSIHCDIAERDARVMVMQRKERMKSAMEDVMMEYVFRSGAPSPLDTSVLDSTLTAKLDEQGIDYSFSHHILHDPHEHGLFEEKDTASSSEWEFRTKLYPSDPGPFSPELVVHVKPGNTSVFMRILPQIIFSFLITAGMLLLFLMIYREALKQKKIGEIRRDFINNMTHEFKTPLATMSLAADTIMNEKVIGDKEKVKYYAEQIKAENRKLNQQVEKVLELALTEKTGVVMNKEQVNLTELVLRAMRSMQMQVESKGGSIMMETNPQEILINADAFHLERVFVNLFDNALKYGGTPPLITVSMQPYRSGTEIRITDNGKGMASSDWELIFEPFHRVSTGDVHNVKGFGLGLSYAKSVITEHGGSISVARSSNNGTTFTVVMMHG
jgi:signal transduction histidine kinase